MSAEPRVLSGRYQVGELIGQGGMARVYRGTDLTLGRTVAIKILNPELARDTAFRTRFRLEAQAASRMAHPSVVRVFDAGEHSETDAQGTHAVPYIVMELVDGEQLKDVIARGPVDVATTVKYVDGKPVAIDLSPHFCDLCWSHPLTTTAVRTAARRREHRQIVSENCHVRLTQP